MKESWEGKDLDKRPYSNRIDDSMDSSTVQAKSPTKWICAALVALMVVLLFWAMGLLHDNQEAGAEVASLSEKVEALTEENNSLQSDIIKQKRELTQKEEEITRLETKADENSYSTFFVKCIIGVIYEDDDIYFHTPICTEKNENASFFVLTSNACDALGYSPCRTCHSKNDIETIKNLLESNKEPVKPDSGTLNIYKQDEPSDEQSVTVYVTNTGGKYHRWGCQYLSQSCIPIFLDSAIRQGYTACSRCW